MALFQPSNIYPSSLSGLGSGVVDVNESIYISWQVNGNSAMTGFKILIQTNEEEPIDIDEFEVDDISFYGTDADGYPIYYVYAPDGVTWASSGLVQGREYRMSITQKWNNNGTTEEVQQHSPSVFITRATPILSISPSSTTLDTISQVFTGTWEQSEGDGVSWVRWILKDNDGNVLKDTGNIYTAQLSFEYNGFFSGKTYTLTCIAESENGVEVSTEGEYEVAYSSSDITDGIEVKCNRDNSVTLSWSVGKDIPATPSADDWGELLDGVLHLNANRSIAWDTVNGEPMDFSVSLYDSVALFWKGRVRDTIIENEVINSGTWEIWKYYTGQDTTQVTLNVDCETRDVSRDPMNSVEVYVTTSETKNVTETYSFFFRQKDVTDNLDGTFTAKTLLSPEIPLNTSRQPMLKSWGVEVGNPVPTNMRLESAWTTFQGKDAVQLYFTTTVPEFIVNVYVFMQYAEGTATYTIPDMSGDPRDFGVASTTAYYATAEQSSQQANVIDITIMAKQAGTYLVVPSWYTTYEGDDAYYGVATGKLDSTMYGTLVSANIESTTATGGGSSYVELTGENRYKVTLYNVRSQGRLNVTLNLVYEHDVTGSDSYRSVITGSHNLAVAGEAIAMSSDVDYATVAVDDGNYTVTIYASTNTPQNVTIAFDVLTPRTNNLALLTVGDAVMGIENDVIKLFFQGTQRTQITLPTYAWEIEMRWEIGSDGMEYDAQFYNYNGNMLFSFVHGVISYPSGIRATINSVVISGEQYCDYIFITRDAYFKLGDTPVWNGKTLFYATFNETLNAGTNAETGVLTTSLYRKSEDEMALVGVFSPDVTEVTDYGIRSDVPYTYELYFVANDKYSTGIASEQICRRFDSVSLTEAIDNGDGSYTPIKTWRFANNIQGNAVSNGNTPSVLKNFTRYPVWQPSSPSAKTGTLTALLSYFVNGEYEIESYKDMEEAYAISESVNPLFLKDLKGNIYMVKTSSPISQTANIKTSKREVTITIPWTEVGDASNARIYKVDKVGE